MCGLGGIASLRGGRRPTREEMLRMAGALFHRGPDEQGIFVSERVGFAHTRLSIIDLTSGQQPMQSSDGKLVMVFNGEIFDYLEIKKELEKRGRVFRTKSDTEVLLQSYEEWGLDCFERFNGQWAVAIWDARKGELVLARDRVGVRPLHVGEHAGRVYFASEVKAIFAADRDFPRALDPRAMDQALTFWCPIAPATPFVRVEEVEPGCARVLGAESRRTHVCFQWDMREIDIDEAEAIHRVGSALEQATHLRMVRADVPVGSYLSGGLDSALVAALGARDRGSGFKTFSVRFEDQELDETEHQRAVVERLGSDHHEIVCTRADVARALPDVVYHAERPLLRAAPAPLFLLSKLAHEAGAKVVLTGEGADEMFAGYDIFREAKVRRFCARRPESKLRARLVERLYPWLARSPLAQREMAARFFLRGLEHAREPGFSHALRWETTASLKRLLTPRFAPEGDERSALGLPARFEEWSDLARDQWIELRTLLSGYLLSSQGDRMLMAHSVEGRFPFLDRDVMALAARLPARLKLRVLEEKWVLKRAARGLVPEAILARPKQPYRAPDAAAFAAGGEWIDEILSEASVRDLGVFEPALVARLWDKVRGKSGPFSNTDNMALVLVLSTQLLTRRLLRDPIAIRKVTPKTLLLG